MSQEFDEVMVAAPGSQRHVMVGFNRRFAPLTEAVGEYSGTGLARSLCSRQ